MRPGGFYLTGEHGPELIRVGATSSIANARDTSRLMQNAGGGGTTHVEQHFHFPVTGMGISDVDLRVQKGIVAAAPQIASLAANAINERRSRYPSSSGG